VIKIGEIKDLLKDIEIIRARLEGIINEKQGKLLDKDVVEASKVLNVALNKYNKILDENVNKQS